jgi:DNA-binding LytR/AlgR family response regulator
MIYKCLIVDDESLARELIETHLSQLDNFKLIASCSSAIAAHKVLQSETIDLMFLDIEMPVLKGTDFLKTLKHKPKVIFTTAYRDYAIEGFNLNAVDYILKPNTTSFFLKGDKKHHQIHFEDLLFIEAYGHYTKVYLKNDMIVSNQKISDFDNLLPKLNFIRIHKSFVVAINKIKHIEGNRALINEYKIPIGQTYKSNLNKLF